MGKKFTGEDIEIRATRTKFLKLYRIISSVKW